MANVLTRMARLDDFAEWLPLWKGYQAFYKTTIADEVSATTWHRFHDDGEPMHCAVAELDGRLVGMVHYIFHRSCWTTGDYCYLQDLFVLKDHRGQHVGRSLIEHVYTDAARRQASRVYWLTHETNDQAMQLYDRIASRSGFLQYRKMLS